MTDQPDPQRHPKMVAAAQHLAQQGFEISRMPIALGKGGKYRWKADATSDPALIPNLLAGAHNSVVIPRGDTVVIDADREDAAAFLSTQMPPGFRVASPTTGHFHFYARCADPSHLPDVYEGGEVRRDPGGKNQPGGAGGMVIGPWSRTDAGVYQRVGDSADIPELPEAVVSYLIEHSAGKTASLRPPTNGALIQITGPTPGYELPDKVGEGGRYPAIVRYTAHLYNREFSTEEMWDLVETRLAPRFEKPYDGSDGRTLRGEFDKAIIDLPTRLGERYVEKRRRAEQVLSPTLVGVPQNEETLGSALHGLIYPTQAAPSPAAGEWLIEGLLKPKGLFVLAGEEGLGKSWVRVEMAIRLATGHGALFEAYPIKGKHPVLLLDEENGEDIEFEREEFVLDALGLTRQDLGWNYARMSFGGTDLTTTEGRQAFEARIASAVPKVVIVDTGGDAVNAAEWGEKFLGVMRYARNVSEAKGIVIGFVVHLTKPDENSKEKAAREKGGRSLTSVMGHWGRKADSVWLMSPAEGDKVHFHVRKRWGESHHILERANDLWKSVKAVMATRTSKTTTRNMGVLGALKHGGPAKVEGDPSIFTYLSKQEGAAMSVPTIHRALKTLAESGDVESVEGVWSLTPQGESSLLANTRLGVRLVLGQ